VRIFFIINSSFPNYGGGIENWLYNVSNRLSGFDVTIISLERDDLPTTYGRFQSNVTIHSVKTFRSFKLLRPFIRSSLVLLDLFLGSYFMGNKLAKLISNKETYCIVALDSIFTVYSAVRAISKVRTRPVKFVSSVRGPHAEIFSKSFPLFSRFIHRLERTMLRNVDEVWANGYDTIDLLNKKGIHSKLMKNGVDYDRLVNIEVTSKLIISDKFSIASIGTLLPIKGVYELIEATAIIKNKFKIEIIVYFIGKGKEEAYHNYAVEKGVGSQIFFTGHMDTPIAYAKRCKLIACLSGGSGMSMAAIESMTSGVPIIAWDSPVYRQFNREILTMTLVKENDTLALAQGIVEIITNYKSCESLAMNAKEQAREYDWEIISKRMINLLSGDR